MGCNSDDQVEARYSLTVITFMERLKELSLLLSLNLMILVVEKIFLVEQKENFLEEK